MSLKYWIWLSSLVDLKPATRFKFIGAFGNPEAVFYADDRSIAEKVPLTKGEKALLSVRRLDEASKILEDCHTGGISIITINDASYPERLRNIYDPPVVLYVKGRLPAMDEQAAIGIVGTRRATPYGIKMARSFAFDLSGGGGLVVTGLAAGIDSAAAEGALRAGGAVVGVLGCAIDDVFPKNNDALYRDVSAVGALVSEYPPGTPIFSKSFPERNRIVSGLSVGTLIIEAPTRSGALITASRALEQGREVFAVPGNLDAPNSAGSNRLIREGATIVTNAWDILSEFSERFPDKIADPDKIREVTSPDGEEPAIYPAATAIPAERATSQKETGKGFFKLRVRNERKSVDKPKEREYIDLREQLSGLSEIQLKIVSVINEKSKHVDDIIDESGLNVATVLAELTVLEIKGFVLRENGKRFALNLSGQK